MTSSHSVSYFSPPLAHWQQPLSFRTAKYEPRKRRKKSWSDGEDSFGDTGDEKDGLESDEGGRSGTEERSTYSSTPARSSVLLSPDEAHQYRIAGQSVEGEVPGGNFPHGVAPADRTGRLTKNEIETELSKLHPPVFIPNPGRDNLHLRHLTVITTVLHRCLMEGDYIRAGRAWGLILRENFGGHPIDIRTGGRWGIGAEILLWRDENLRTTGQTGDGNGSKDDTVCNREWFSRRGFERAKSYYERLILQYPFRKAAPHALSALDFYPAMFGLWIATIQQESRTKKEATSADEEDFNTFMEEPNDDLRQKDCRKEQTAAELAEAQQIASQMNELLGSFPYSDSYELLRLRGMVSLWIADLHVSAVSTDDDNMSFDEDGDGDIAMEHPGCLEERLAAERKTAEVEKAHSFFDKANARGNRASAVPLTRD